MIHGVKPIKLAELEENYMQCTFGNIEPTHLRIHTALYPVFLDLLTAAFPPERRHPDWKRRFNNAELVMAHDMAIMGINFCTITHILDQRYNCWRDEKGFWSAGSNYPMLHAGIISTVIYHCSICGVLINKIPIGNACPVCRAGGDYWRSLER